MNHVPLSPHLQRFRYTSEEGEQISVWGKANVNNICIIFIGSTIEIITMFYDEWAKNSSFPGRVSEI